MMDTPTKVAVIGVGSMGRNHARVYSELPEAELVAVVDADLKTAEAVASNHGVHAYTDIGEMLKKEKPEAVSIAVPTALHTQMGLTALEAGAQLVQVFQQSLVLVFFLLHDLGRSFAAEAGAFQSRLCT